MRYFDRANCIYIEDLPKKKDRSTEMTNEEYLRIIDLYASNIYKIAFCNCKNKYDAEDVFQNVLLKLYHENRKFETDEHVKRWLIRVTVNECHNIWSSFWKRKVAFITENRPEAAYTDGTESAGCLNVVQAVKQLPEKYRNVIHLFYYEDYSVKEISKILRLKESTVQTQLMRGRNLMKQLLEVWNDER